MLTKKKKKNSSIAIERTLSKRLSNLRSSTLPVSRLLARASRNSSVCERYTPFGWNPALYGAPPLPLVRCGVDTGVVDLEAGEDDACGGGRCCTGRVLECVGVCPL